MSVAVALLLAALACFNVAGLLALLGSAALDGQNLGTRVMAFLMVLAVLLGVNAYAVDGFANHFGF